MTLYNDQEYDQIVSALAYMQSANTDHATVRNDIGYNKLDSDFGLSLYMASIKYRLTEKQQHYAVKILRKYRRQLDTAGIELPELRKINTNGNTPAREKIDAAKFAAKETGKPQTVATQSPAPAQKSDPKNPPRVHVDLLDDGQLALRVKPFIWKNDDTNRLLDEIKSLPQRKFVKKYDSAWVVPASYIEDVKEKWNDAVWSSAAQELLNNNKELAAMAHKDESDFDVEGLTGGELMPFQRAGVEFLERANGRAILADEMGLGKTIQAIAFLQLHPELRPAVIVVPAGIKINWQIEIQKWLSSNAGVHVISGRKIKPLPTLGTHIYIINYDILHNWIEEIEKLNPAIVIMDEAHYLKNGKKTKRGKAGWGLAEKIEKTILLTGTPVTNRPMELYPLLNMIDPAGWNNKFWFEKEYAAGEYTEYGWNNKGASNLDKLHKRIQPYVVRRLKENVKSELPDKRRVTVNVEFDPKERAQYNAVLRKTQKAIEDNPGKPGMVLAQIEHLKQAAARGKMKSVFEWIDNAIAGGDKLIVFAHHKEIIDLLVDRYAGKCVSVTGSVTGEKRQAAIDTFQNDPNILLFVGNIKAAGVGITLTASSNVVFVEFAWTPADMIQAEDRAHRIGQKNAVTVWNLVATDTIDEMVVGLLEDKRQIIDQIHDGKIGDQDFSIVGELMRHILKKENDEEDYEKSLDVTIEQNEFPF